MDDENLIFKSKRDMQKQGYSMGISGLMRKRDDEIEKIKDEERHIYNVLTNIQHKE